MSIINARPLLFLNVEFFQQFFDAQTVVGGNAFEDAGEGSGFDRMMMGNYLVVFPVRRSNIFSVNSVRLTEGCQRFFVDLG